jgi:Protein of unknown function (DUF5132)
MALFEDFIAWTRSSWVSTLAVGTGAVLVAPVVLPVVGASARLLAKAVIKGGILVVNAGTSAVAEVGEQLRDLVAEVREELGTTPSPAPTQTTASPLVDPYGRTTETVGAA